MTVTVVFGKVSDGYLWNYDPTYSGARNAATADGVNNTTVGYFGQNNNDSLYAVFQTFIGFDYSAIPDTERVTAAMVRMKPCVVRAPGVTQEAYVLGYAYGTLAVADWRTPTQFNAARVDAQMGAINLGLNKFAMGGSDEFLAAMIPVTSMEEVVISSRQKSQTTPTTDEGFAIWTADLAGTADDPALIYTSALRSTLYGVMGAQAQLSDGTWVYLESDGAVAPVITLKHETVAGVITSIGTIPIGTSTSSFFTPRGAQNFALVVDASDNIYIFAGIGNAENTLGARAYTKGVGYTWAAQTVRSAALPTISTAINQCVATIHTTAGGVANVVVGHTAGPGHPTTTTGIMNAQVSLAYLRTGTGTMILGSRSVEDKFFPFVSRPDYLNTYPNEVGNGMDVAAAINGNTEWGFFYSFQHGMIPGDNDELASCRYIMNATATSYTHHTTEPGLGWGRKDANGKVRVVPISSSTACFVSADADAGYGITVYVQQHSGTETGSVTLEGQALSGEGVASVPDGPAIAQSSAWDCIYNSTENKLWIYYVDVADGGRIMRTSFDLTTYQYDRNAVQVYSHASGTVVCQGIRVERNKAVTQNGLVSVAWIDGATRSLMTIADTFNLAPTAPTLTPRVNYDATAAAVFDWTFNDPNVSDTQSAFQLEISRVSDGVIIHDTGKIVSAVSDRTVAGATLTNGVEYRWRVRTYDALDAVSPYSGYGTFSTSAGGTVTITSPATDNVIGIVTDDYPITWSVVGTVQAAYKVILTRGVVTVSDTGWVASVATTATIAGMTSDVEHTVSVQVRNAALVVSGIGTRKITPSFAVPEVPTVSAAPNTEAGFILVTVDNPPPGAPALGLPEEDFETSVGAFTSASGGTFTRVNTVAHKGSWSGKLETVGTPTSTYVRPAQVACVPGQRLTVRMWAYRPVAGNMQCTLDWFDAAHVYISTSAAQTALVAATWTTVQASGTAPSNAAFVSWGPTIPSNPPAATILYVDEVVLTGASDRPDVGRNEILRRVYGETGDWEVLGECDPDGTFADYEAAAGVVYEYIARGQVV